ncbi:hypothetical protein CMQ_2593 [Grosmannia clavigera kw1407]|uniref:Benzoylformate decarboxylase n=1 Tax=Grosmannia clavigera (strain kw1407 / UAMH 11150) TaxID=655863 RepID=F0XG98_GROCL|nr:uncharacterized protein CMQ_2593 [Grosmannia clavigera kw1407]EFX02664.1 hypothetical protein CMQ_2593 [Grosmannia clavigera kw1407]
MAAAAAAAAAAASAPSIPTTLRSPPSVSAYTSLADHQSSTPASFFDGPPVLHYHAKSARAYISREQRAKLPWGSAPESAGSPLGLAMGDTAQHVVDVFVGSETLSLYCPAADCGLALPYPVIGLHAIKSATAADGHRVPTVYMQLELDVAGGGNDDGGETVELSLVPEETTAAESAPTAETTPPQDTTAPPQSLSEASRLFDAISACADLHPDRFGGDNDDDDDAYPSFFGPGEGDDDDDDGIAFDDGDLEPVEGFQGVFRRGANNNTEAAVTQGSDLPPPLPGSGGWITAENAHEFFDADGNWLGRDGSGPLGEGAGRVRGRDEVDEAAAADETSRADAAADAGEAQLNGDGSETKRPRTE